MEINKKLLAKALELASKNTGKGNLPILQYVKIGEGKLEATNLDRGIIVEIPAIEGESICVHCQKLLTVVNSIQSEAVELKNKDGKMVVSGGGSKFSLLTLPAEEFPAQQVEVDGEPQTIEVLPDAFMAVQTAASFDPTRFILCGAYMDGEKGAVVATDGRRLHKVDVEFPATAQSIIPNESVKQIISLGANQVATNKGGFVCTGEVEGLKYTFRTKTIDGKYPTWNAVIPREEGSACKFASPENLVAAIKRAMLVNQKNDDAIMLELAPDSITITARSSEYGDFKETVEAKYDGWEGTIAVRPTYLLDAITAACRNKPQFVLEIKDELSPVVVKSEGFVAVVMPIRKN